jgi:hypothetical protein
VNQCRQSRFPIRKKSCAYKTASGCKQYCASQGNPHPILAATFEKVQQQILNTECGQYEESFGDHGFCASRNKLPGKKLKDEAKVL